MQSEKAGRSGRPGTFLTFRKVKILSWILGVVLAGVVVWQNWGPMDTTIVFIKIRMPRVAFVGIVLLVGFVIGLTSPSVFVRRGKA